METIEHPDLPLCIRFKVEWHWFWFGYVWEALTGTWGAGGTASGTCERGELTFPRSGSDQSASSGGNRGWQGQPDRYTQSFSKSK